MTEQMFENLCILLAFIAFLGFVIYLAKLESNGYPRESYKLPEQTKWIKGEEKK